MDEAVVLSSSQPVQTAALKILTLATSEKTGLPAKRQRYDSRAKMNETAKSAARQMRKSMSSLDSFPILASKMTLSPRNPSPQQQRPPIKLPGIDAKGKKLPGMGKTFRYKVSDQIEALATTSLVMLKQCINFSLCCRFFLATIVDVS